MLIARRLVFGRGLARRAPGITAAFRAFGGYEGRDVTDEELIKESDDWAIEETNFCLGRIPRRQFFPETSDLARRTLQIIETQKSRMFTRLRDGTVIAVTFQVPHGIFDDPCSIFNWFERAIYKHTWDETYDDAWEEEEPEFDDAELPAFDEAREEEEAFMDDPSYVESELIRRASGGND